MMCLVGCYCVGRHLELWKLCALVAASPRSRCKVCSWFCIAILESALITIGEQTEPHTTLTLQGLSSSHLVFDRMHAWQAFSVLLRITRSPCSAFSCEARWRLSKSLDQNVSQAFSSHFCKVLHSSVPLHQALEIHSILSKKHHRPGSEIENVEWTCRSHQCCTYARLKPFPQSAHLYARSLSSVLEHKHYYSHEELQCFAYGTLDVGLGGPLSHRSYGRRSSDALAGGGWWPQGLQSSSESCSPCLLSVRVDCRYGWVVVADRRLRWTSYCSSSYRKRV